MTSFVDVNYHASLHYPVNSVTCVNRNAKFPSLFSASFLSCSTQLPLKYKSNLISKGNQSCLNVQNKHNWYWVAITQSWGLKNRNFSECGVHKGKEKHWELKYDYKAFPTLLKIWTYKIAEGFSLSFARQTKIHTSGIYVFTPTRIWISLDTSKLHQSHIVWITLCSSETNVLHKPDSFLIGKCIILIKEHSTTR